MSNKTQQQMHRETVAAMRREVVSMAKMIEALSNTLIGVKERVATLEMLSYAEGVEHADA